MFHTKSNTTMAHISLLAGRWTRPMGRTSTLEKTLPFPLKNLS